MRSATVWLLIVNAVVFLVHSILDYYTRLRIGSFLALNPIDVIHGQIWQLLTFQFLHSDLWHLLLNSVVIYLFGRSLEDSLGLKRFLQLYFLSGVAGGLLQITVGLLFPSHFGVTVGASAGAFGLVAAFATLNPEQPLTALVAFFIPVTMRAKFLLLFSGLIALYGILVPRDSIAHAAHLGGLIWGMAYVTWWIRPANGLFGLRIRNDSEPEPELVTKSSPIKNLWRQQLQNKHHSSAPASGDYISREVDPILDKISAHGIHSLTARERRILEEARKRMGTD